MAQKKLKLGAAYHGNRMLHHVRKDMEDMAVHGMNLVVHMFTQTDMDRNKNIMKEVVKISEEAGLEVCERFEKDHNLWIRTYNSPRGDEEDIVEAAEAAYDAGARMIIAWGYYGSDGVDYTAKNPAVVWAKTNEAFARIRNMERDRILAENRRKYLHKE